MKSHLTHVAVVAAALACRFTPDAIAQPRPQGPGFEEKHKAILDDSKPKEGLKLFWFATGKDDFLVETSRKTVEMFKSHKFDVTYNETGGAHTWDKWREYLNEFAPKLFQ